MSIDRVVRTLLLICGLCLPAQHCQAESFCLSIEATTFSDTEIHILVAAHVHTDPLLQRGVQVGNKRFGVLRIALPEEPLSAPSLKTTCWCLPQLEGEPDPIVAPPFFCAPFSEEAFLVLDTLGNVAWHRHTKSQNGVDHFRTRSCTPFGSEWSMPTENIQISTDRKVELHSHDYRFAMWHDREVKSSTEHLSRWQGMSRTDHEFTKPIGEALSRLGDACYFPGGIFQDGDGVWSSFPTCAEITDGPFRKEVQSSREDLFFCRLDSGIPVRTSPPVVDGAIVQRLLHAFTTSKNSLVATFQLCRDEVQSVVAVEYTDRDGKLCQEIPTAYRGIIFGPIYYLRKSEVFVAVDKFTGLYESAPLGKRVPDTVKLHFWNHRSGKYVTKEIHLGSRFWFDRSMTFRCERP